MDILLETERLILRRLSDDDAEAVHAIQLEKAVRRTEYSARRLAA